MCVSCLFNLGKTVPLETPTSALEKLAQPANCYFKELVEDWNEWTPFTVEPPKISGEMNKDMWPIIDKVMKSANMA